MSNECVKFLSYFSIILEKLAKFFRGTFLTRPVYTSVLVYISA